MKVKIDKELCTGDSICVDICPEVFQMGEDDQAEVILDVVPEELEEACREASESCPEGCIFLEE